MTIAMRQNATQEWQFILDVMREYAERNRQSEVAGYAQQLYQLAVHSHRGRKEAGGWAGEFTRTLLMIAARDTAERAEYWDNPSKAWWRSVCDPLFGDLCGTTQAGWEHFDDHLAPGFYEYMHKALFEAGRAGPRETAAARIFERRDELIEEHKALIERGVAPAALLVPQYGNMAARRSIAFVISGDATSLRHRTLDRIRLELTRAGLLGMQDSIRFAQTLGGVMVSGF